MAISLASKLVKETQKETLTRLHELYASTDSGGTKKCQITVEFNLKHLDIAGLGLPKVI